MIYDLSSHTDAINSLLMSLAFGTVFNTYRQVSYSLLNFYPFNYLLDPVILNMLITYKYIIIRNLINIYYKLYKIKYVGVFLCCIFY